MQIGSISSYEAEYGDRDDSFVAEFGNTKR